MTNYDFKVQLRIDTILSKVIATVFRRKNVTVIPVTVKLKQYNLLWPNKTSLDDRIEPVTSYKFLSKQSQQEDLYCGCFTYHSTVLQTFGYPSYLNLFYCMLEN